MQEPIDLETVPITPEIYPHLKWFDQILKQLPRVKDIVYFKTQMLRNEIVDVS